MNELISQTFLTPILSFIGALLAAWLGTILGLRKFRQERAFDARLEWHRKLAETSRVLLNRMRAFRTFQKGKVPQEAVLPILHELNDLAFEFQEKSELASLYAEKQTYLAIRDVLKYMSENARAYWDY